MQGKELHDFLFKLYDYADDLASRIHEDEPYNGKYFLALVYLEKYFDGIGREEISRAAREMGEAEPGKALSEAHRRIDLLREKIANLVRTYDFNSVLDNESARLMQDWRKK